MALAAHQVGATRWNPALSTVRNTTHRVPQPRTVTPRRSPDVAVSAAAPVAGAVDMAASFVAGREARHLRPAFVGGGRRRVRFPPHPGEIQTRTAGQQPLGGPVQRQAPHVSPARDPPTLRSPGRYHLPSRERFEALEKRDREASTLTRTLSPKPQTPSVPLMRLPPPLPRPSSTARFSGLKSGRRMSSVPRASWPRIPATRVPWRTSKTMPSGGAPCSTSTWRCSIPRAARGQVQAADGVRSKSAAVFA